MTMNELSTHNEWSKMVCVCPGCGQPIEPGDDYVVAREYESAPDFSLHMNGDERARPTRRFHVAHFRRQIGERVYELVHDEMTLGHEGIGAHG